MVPAGKDGLWKYNGKLTDSKLNKEENRRKRGDKVPAKIPRRLRNSPRTESEVMHAS
jgi:hypothetical protein